MNAVRVEKILAEPPVKIPDWATEALSEGQIIKLPDNTLTVTTPQGKRIGKVGDMLIKDMVGDLALLPVATFMALYEKVMA